MDSRILSAEHARESGVDRPWEQTNEDWWDWYLSLADARDGAPTELVAVDPPDAVALPTLDELREELATPYELGSEAVERFERDGYVKLRDVLSPGALAAGRAEVLRLAAAGDGPGRSGFLSMDLMWRSGSEVLELFALSPRIGRIAADLLQVAEVRLYHDNVLSKEPGCGRTPWHFDAHHFPIASRDVVTSWVPLQAIPAPMGPLAFAAGKDVWKTAEAVDFSSTDDSYDRGVAEAFRAADVQVDDSPFALGEISFHHSWCFHYARPNATTQPRMVHASTYFADGARLVDEPTMVSGDWQRFMPGARPGAVIDTPLNPIVSR
ncbi:phytanoyl-CoA dioxygenase family protein [Paraconexibacter algicola]|uniref:SnoK n=1 Tax=Paraconexibacter algicola TaxID=2133960 RepID=A0A2T4UBR8_9ACTN|nr:phytanoyl-CoA dioxygenase family protein [Paraconexibacter algicola]PTL54349.1 snoK [Paraconexibacter algicola]